MAGAVTPSPRLLSGPAAAAYLGITPATFAKWVAAGTAPRPIAGTRRWDRKAIDLMLDKASGIIAPSIVSDGNEALEKWMREDAARKAAARTGGRK